VLNLPKIYAITDTRISGLSHSDQVKQLAEGGARLVQLREKNASTREFFEEAVLAVDVARSAGIIVIINDRVDIALAIGAGGVHLGQDDMPPDDARRLLGQDAIIGYSTHSVAEAAVAAQLQVDYIAVGPIFATMTKPDHEAVVGLSGVRAVRAALGRIPLVAIGGITLTNSADVLRAGADSVAVISDILRPPSSISKRLAEFDELLSSQQ
jgi:thiamine-phosphate pyrophosphorylase